MRLRAARASSGVWLLAAAGLCVPAARADQPGGTETVRVIRNVSYYDGKDADPVRHRLDLYLPRDRREYPVLVFAHGGAWVLGDKRVFGWGPYIGRYFAAHGIGVVFPSYRLAPAARHPEQVKDMARAFAWTVRHIGCYGGDPQELFLCGHSAGGHLVCLLATDPAYLKKEGLGSTAIRGVISVSGVYRIPALDLTFGLPGVSTGTLRSLTELFAAPKATKGAKQAAAGRAGQGKGPLDIPLNLFKTVFGCDPKACAAASPISYVRPGLPPFLLINAQYDLPFLPQMARDFARALRAAHDDVDEMVIKDRGHEDVMFRATSGRDPVARAIEDFVHAHCPPPASAADAP
jgi:acetyl esterase/lipase